MLFNSYRKKLAILFLIIAVVPIMLFGISISTKINEQIISENIQIKTNAVINEAEKLDIWFKINEEKLRDMSGNYAYIKNIISDSDNVKSTDQRMTEYLASQLTSSNEIQNVHITMQDGTEYTSTGEVSDYDTRLRNWYLNATLNKDIVWTVLNRGEDGKKLIVTASIPLFNENKEIDGVLAADFDFSDKLSGIDNINIDNSAITYIVDNTNNILRTFHNGSLSDDTNKELLHAIKMIYNDFRTNSSGNTTIEQGEEYLVFYSVLPSINWKIISFLPSEDFYYSLAISYRYITGIAAITFILVIAMSLIFSRTFSRPLEKLKDGATEIQNGNYDFRMDVKTNDEFGKVAGAFNDMISKLKESYAKLNETNEELKSNNLQLQEMNMELESSYQQLKAATDQLDESELKYRVLIENMYDFVWVTDNELNVIFVNDQVENVLKFNKNDILGKNIAELSYLIPEYRGNIIEDLKKADHKKEYILIDKDGNQVITEMTTKRIYEKDCLIGVQGVVRDITQRKSMEKDIITRNRELSVINKMSDNINATSNIKSLLQTVTDEIYKLLRTYLCTIRLVNGNILKLMAVSGELTDLVLYEDISLNNDVLGDVVATGDPLISDISTCQLKLNYNKNAVEAEKITHNNIFPIKSRGKVLGIMCIDGERALNKSEINIINSITNQVAVKIENINLYNGLKENYIKTIETLAAAIEAKDDYTEGHSSRVSKYSYLIAQSLGFSKKYCEDIEIAGILHDVGKIGISDTILSKPGRLTEHEFEMVAEHPMIGSRILEGIGFSDVIMNAIRFHHKRYDLKGYPKNVELDELPLEACIVGVADAFDAMTSNRSYRVAISVESAIEELIKNKGTQFHPYVVDIVIDLYKNKPEVIREIIEYQTMIS